MAKRYVEIEGTADFKTVARKLREAGDGQVAKEMGKALKASASPLVEDAQRRVQSLAVAGVRGGASARAARAAKALGRRKRLTEKAKQKAHRGSGLRATVARATSAKVTTGARSATMRVRAAASKMPADQRKLPRYLNTGRWRHPVFGQKDKPWVTQVAPPAWFDDAAEAKGPEARDQAIKVVAEYLERIV
ncbi:hypothetical protein [Saccharothrix variisporea]|uniref:HK97 gp10 family phage protein n=1 Tax=Saccharothrix variisporea TaxID=543527 RepID=A0A495X3D6_9PSEU|nr:hypothetical protein [Saccharothrix variisporea]RKT67113.1 hypothetical protein DFJ66_0281 [Saccharothrix variisporea]